MSAFPQVEMQPLYGICHYALRVIYDLFFRGEVAGLDNVPKDGAFLVAANHASHLDPPMIGCHIPRQMAFFARRTLWKGGISTWWLDGVGCVPVDRDGGADVGAIKGVLRVLQAGKALTLFPEGTRSADGRLQAPKAGVGMIACKTRVCVLPVRIFNSHIAFGRDGRLRLGTRVDIVYGRPLQPADYDNPADGKDRYQKASERIMSAIAALRPPPVQVI
ncbi:lysophospholipid acyltransferase family protein [Geminisphaera colitermitum]|uniref:lysophospholipid acyltransferase family protein n=1 Tax=Geminisphaera colitermitum TaxID=1148786 RepID=UPI000158C588|nr:lysophospholipid acyltransferase family protein [Geminisphaera colitermitum]